MTGALTALDEMGDRPLWPLSASWGCIVMCRKSEGQNHLRSVLKMETSFLALSTSFS